VNAVFGLGMQLQRFLNERACRHVAVAFDAGAITFRNEIYPAYKANRGEPPADLVPQFDLCRRLTEAMGLATIRLPGFEADDVLATLARRLQEDRWRVVLVTGDKDMAQILRPGVRILDLARGVEWGHEEVPARLGVRAEQVVDLLALMGDPVDNIPGIRGVGAKSAAGLLARFRDVDHLYENLDAVETLPLRGARSLRRKLEEGRELMRLSRRLARLAEDAPVDLDPGELLWEGADGETLDAFAETWGLGRVARRVPRRPGS
jgi:5'-3' exonuclease